MKIPHQNPGISPQKPQSQPETAPPKSSVALDSIRNGHDGASAPSGQTTRTSSTTPTMEWVGKQVTFIRQQVEFSNLDHHLHTCRVKDAAEALQRSDGVPFNTSISALREAFKDEWQPVQTHADEVLSSATYWHKKEAAAFTGAIFNGKNTALEEKINALPEKVATSLDDAAVLRKELKEIVKDVQNVGGVKGTPAGAVSDLTRLQLANIYHDSGSLLGKAAGRLVEEHRLQIAQLKAGS